MLPRLVTMALLLAVAIAFPLGAYARECQEVVVFFDGSKEVLDVINLGQTNVSIGFLFFKDDGTFVCDSLRPIGAQARVSLSAKAVYQTPCRAPNPLSAIPT
ncbi:MAG TPA: hypothetical protein VMS64_19980 [Candidatus Methylomirabilis sp.]|nr:hypothetical protein [Candidatus Methylomirabilis sp.]